MDYLWLYRFRTKLNLMKKLNLRTFLRGAKVVGVIASLPDLQVALADPDIADIYEWRVDCISCDEVISGLQYLRLLGKLVILTVRDPAEGGQKPEWGLWYRQIVMLEYLYVADVIDIEALNAIRLRRVIAAVQERDILVIISGHFLTRMPSKAQFLWVRDVYKALGDILKTAILIENARDMVLYKKWVMPLMRHPTSKGRIAPMATGETYGPSSRLWFAKKGAVLVYGSLSKAVIKGQLSVREFRAKLGKRSYKDI